MSRRSSGALRPLTSCSGREPHLTGVRPSIVSSPAIVYWYGALRSDHMQIIAAWTKRLLSLGLVLWSWQPAFCSEPGFEVSLQVTGGAHRIFRQGIDHPVLEITGWSRDSASHDLVVSFAIFDMFNRPKPETIASVNLHLPEDSSTASAQVSLGDRIGYYSIVATVSDGERTVTRSTDLGTVCPPYPGFRPDSFFASNVPPQQGENLQLLESIGLKVQRTHFAPYVATSDVNWPKDLPPGEAAPLDFAANDLAWKEMRDHGLWVLPIAGNSLAGDGVFDQTPMANQLRMYGPPGDKNRFINTWASILKHYPEITTFEFWNEPWIFGWTWAAPPDEYRDLQRDFCKMALAINPHYRLLAGNSVAFVRDVLEPFPDCWEGLLEGVTNHPYADGVVEKNFRSGDVFRPIDETRLTARDLGLPYAYITEGGTAYKGPPSEPEPYDNNENAQKLVQYYVFTALAGLNMGDAQWEIGYGPGWTRSNTAFAVLTHFLEDRVPLVDIWPRQELVWGGIFANRRFATPDVESLPRGSELKARWNIGVPPDRDQDATKIAVIWGLTGRSAECLDTQGELVIANATDLHAYDMMGEEIAPADGQLILPLSANPVYVTSDSLDVLTLRERIRNGHIRQVTPFNLYALSLQKPASETQDLIVRMQNQINQRFSGTLILQVAGSAEENSTRFSIEPGELAEIRLPWPAAAVRPDNRYPIEITATVDKTESDVSESQSTFSQEQTIAVARFEQRTINLTGAISDWDDLTPVTVDSQWIQPTDTNASALQNPNQPEKSAQTAEIGGRIYTAYDADFVYIGAAIREEHFNCTAGLPLTANLGDKTVTLPYLQGAPNGLRFATECGSVFQFSFGFRDRVPFAGRQIGDPWAWKGVFYDTDYSYVAHSSAQGDQLIRIWGPDTPRRNGYQTENVPGIGPVPGGLIVISRDNTNRLTLYEIKIPRRQLALFNPDAGYCRFGFVVYNSELPTGSINWSDIAGVFDYWKTPGSFPPTWRSHRACQTFFGIEKDHATELPETDRAKLKQEATEEQVKKKQPQ
jgi:hypothetical protein